MNASSNATTRLRWRTRPPPRGLPGFVRNFVGRFDIDEVDGSVRVAQTITVDLVGLKGALALLPMRVQMRRSQRAVLRDLDALARTGSVSPAKAKLG